MFIQAPLHRQARNYIQFIIIEYISSHEAPICKTVALSCSYILTGLITGKTTRKNWWFQQDNARPHTSKVAKSWLRSQDFHVMEWPAKSPDLSWIETLWGYVSKQLSKRTDLTQQNFITEVMKAWDSIPESVQSSIYNSIKARLHACIDASYGGSTKY